MKEIEFTINKETGELTTETMGFKGGSCEETLNKLSELMRSKVINSSNKPERYQVDEKKEKIKVSK